MSYLNSYLALLNTAGPARGLRQSARAEELAQAEQAISEAYDPQAIEVARARKAPQAVLAAGPKACERYNALAMDYLRRGVTRRPAELMREVAAMLRREEGLDVRHVREAPAALNPDPGEAENDIDDVLQKIADIRYR